MTSFFSTIAQRVSRKVRGFVRRFVVPRREYDQSIDALRLAYGHIICHHASHVVQYPGAFCQVCHHEDGGEPEMDKIAAAIHTANSVIEPTYEKLRQRRPTANQKD